jgi:chorismate dehydratase
MSLIGISLPVYLNSVPFLYGLQHSGMDAYADIQPDIPSVCADRLRRGQVDVGLVPVVEMFRIPSARVVSRWCIGAQGVIRTVILASAVPLEQVDTVYLDAHSRTSVTLARLLAREYWQIAPRWVYGIEQMNGTPSGRSGIVLIGDKAFDVQAPYVYDLGEQWQLFTGLPFVFAAWIANRELPQPWLARMEDGLSLGVGQLDEVLREWTPRVSSHIDLDTYWKKQVDFHLDAPKEQAMALFLEKVRQGGYASYLPEDGTVPDFL